MQLSFLPSLGGPEVAIIFVIVLLLFGAKKIPELARGLGKSMGEFKKAREEFEGEIKRAADEVDVETKSDTPAKSEPRES
ncbi:MAG: twin-arginine translocase TatA/TatE family subunit [Roseibacillus sp.]